MIDRVLKQGIGNQQSYYFQLIPLSLTIINAQSQLPVHGTTYRFTISKGQQKFDQNKIPVQANFQKAGNRPVLVINSCRLNFQIPSYFKQRKQDFVLSLVQRQNNQDYDLGQYHINIDDLVTKFKENNMIRHQLKSQFSDDYELDFEIYIEKNRMNLQKIIRENKTQRINKSPLRQRSIDKQQTPKRQFNSNVKKPTSNVKQSQTPSRDVQQKKFQRNPRVQKVTPLPVQEPKEQYVASEETTQQVVIEPTTQSCQVVVQERGRQQTNEEPARVQREVSQKRGKTSQRNEVTSNKSKEKVPIIQTRHKPLKYEGDGQAEIKMKDSQRLGNNTSSQQQSKPSSSESSLQQKLSIGLFLIISLVIMYFAMHPNRKV